MHFSGLEFPRGSFLLIVLLWNSPLINYCFKHLNHHYFSVKGWWLQYLHHFASACTVCLSSLSPVTWRTRQLWPNADPACEQWNRLSLVSYPTQGFSSASAASGAGQRAWMHRGLGWAERLGYCPSAVLLLYSRPFRGPDWKPSLPARVPAPWQALNHSSPAPRSQHNCFWAAALSLAIPLRASIIDWPQLAPLPAALALQVLAVFVTPWCLLLEVFSTLSSFSIHFKVKWVCCKLVITLRSRNLLSRIWGVFINDLHILQIIPRWFNFFHCCFLPLCLLLIVGI